MDSKFIYGLCTLAISYTDAQTRSKQYLTPLICEAYLNYYFNTGVCPCFLNLLAVS